MICLISTRLGCQNNNLYSDQTWVAAGVAGGAGLGGAGGADVPRGQRRGGHRRLLRGQIDRRHLPVLQTLPSLGDLEKLVNDENVEDGEGHNGSHSQECFTDEDVYFEHVIFRYLEVFIRFPNTLCAIDEFNCRV